jgi:spermidine/putrescine transport system ATP-binding protein
MNEGRVVQVGSPREIYTNPATEFASDFIGEINLFNGTVAETADGLVHIKLVTGELLAGKGSEISIGQRATLSVRPESIRVNTFNSLDDSKFRLSGRILDIIFLGSRTRLKIEIADGKVVLADLDDQETIELKIGATVKLSWQIHQANVWKSESGGSQL